MKVDKVNVILSEADVKSKDLKRDSSFRYRSFRMTLEGIDIKRTIVGDIHECPAGGS